MARKSSRAKLGRPVNKDSDETRRSILEAARQCFANTGFRATSTREIAERAGVTVGTIYHYFDNKDTLFAAVHSEIEEQTLAISRETLASATSLTSGWKEIGQQFFHMHQEHPEIAKFNAVMQVERMANAELVDAQYNAQWRELFRDFAKLGVKTGELKPGREHEFEVVLMAITLGISQHAIQASMADHELCLRGFVNLFDGTLVEVK